MTNSTEFVAINYIDCDPDYASRFEMLFSTRAHAIDTMPGFRKMHVLKPAEPGGSYLIVSYWDSEDAFKSWTQSSAFLEGHKRGFEDIAKARAEGKPAPMRSNFKTYRVLAD